MHPASGPSSIEELLAQSSWLRRLAATLVAGEAAAEDLVQETWLAALRHPPRGGGSPRAWLARIARNLASNFRRSEARRSEHEAADAPDAMGRGRDGDPAFDPSTATEEVEAQRVLAEAVLRLEEPLRTVVVLRYLRGLDSGAIARSQGTPAGTVRWRLKRALELLRADLDQRFGGDRERWCSAFALLWPRPSAIPFLPGAPSLAAGVSLMSTATKSGVAAAVLLAGVAAWIWTRESAPTDAGPTIALLAPSGRSVEPPVTLEADRSTPSSERAALAVTETARVDPTPQECCVVGRILDEQGRGVPGARIRARAPRLDGTTLRSQIGDDLTLETTSSVDGAFSLALASGRPFVLCAAHPALAPNSCSPVFAGERRDLILPTGSTLTVQVIDPVAGPRVARAGAEVCVRYALPDSSADLCSSTATTDAEGVATFQGLPAGNAEVEARFELCRASTRAATDGHAPARCELALCVTGRIEGTVVERETGRPIAGARVGNPDLPLDEGDEVVTDALGHYALEGIGLGVGLWSLGARAPGFAPRFELLKLPPDHARRTVDFVLDPGVRVAGRACERDGRPIPRARIVCLGLRPVEPYTPPSIAA